MSDQPPAVGTPTPKRIQRKRTKGWRMPPNTVYVGRPTKWGNPFVPMFRHDRTRLIETVERYRFWLNGGLSHSVQGFPPQPCEIVQLRGKNLACWCPLGQPCHADVLLELANV